METGSKNTGLTFGAFADPQYCDKEPDTGLNRYFRKAADKMHACINHFNKNKEINFVAGLGDFIDERISSFQRVNKIFQQSSKKVFKVAGNHDLEVEKDHLDEVYQELGLLPRPYYSFIKQDWQFLFLDGNDITFNSNDFSTVQRAEQITGSLKAAGKPNFASYNGAMGNEQLCWLEKQLKQAEKDNRNSVLICHYPLLPLTNYSLWNSEKVLAILKKFRGVKLWLNGHQHDGNYAEENGIHFLTLCAMADTEKETAFAEIILEENRILIKGFGREPSRVLEI